MKKLLLVWKDFETRTRYVVGNLTYDNKVYFFKYTNPELSDAQKQGFTCYPGFEDLTKVYESKELFSNISSRLPNKNRDDYLEILNYYNLNSSDDEYEILTRTKGRLLTDTFEFVPPFDKNKIEFEIAGTRYSEEIEKYLKEIKPNTKLALEPTTYKDEPAIKVYGILSKKVFLGYVPRYYAKEIYEQLEKKVNYSAMIKDVKFESLINDEHITANVKLLFS